MFCVIDFETYYGKGVGFSVHTTEEYINHPEFHEIGMGIRVDEGATEWVTGHDAIAARLALIDWDSACVLCHNALFDGAILAWRFDVIPAFYFDTLCMARAIHGVEAGGSLAALASRYGLGQKGTEVENAIGKRLEDFSPEQLERYGEYCKNDVDLTLALFVKLSKKFPQMELDLIDMTIRMFTCPTLYVDDALLVERLGQVREEKQELLSGLMQELDCEYEEGVRAKLSSNPQFADILKQRGVTVPLKTSPATGMETYALAKNDEGFMALQEHEDPIVQQLCAVRLGTKSTLEESRIERFIDIGARNKGKLPIPLKYYGAHTGRWSGLDKVNFQNLPSRDKKKKSLKNSIVAPSGHVIVDCDSSQIEARVLAWWAGQDDVVQAFADGEDVYSTFATKIYGRPISKNAPIERFVGKTCVGLGSLVLCESGWKPIETVSVSDRVWDGEEWVCHQGVVQNGTKKTLELCGLWLTPDHKVWSGTWHRADSLLLDADILSRALDIAVENLPSQATWLAPVAFARLSSDATAGWMNTPLTTITSKILNRLDVTFVQSKQLVKNAIGNTLKLCQMMLTERGYSIALPQLSPAAITQVTPDTFTMGLGESQSAKNGEATAQHFCTMPRCYRGGTTRTYRWTESTTVGDMSRETFDLLPALKICATGEKSQTLKPVFDILNSGLRNRFTVLTERGPLIVHNCVLGLGFGTGAAKLQHTLKTTPPGVDLPLEECKRVVNLYRQTNNHITTLWRECDQALKYMMSGATTPIPLGLHGVVTVSAEGIRLPNGLYIRYNNLRQSGDKIIYDSRKGPQNIWGGAMVENIVQALARIVVAQQMLWINLQHRVVLTVHDAAMCVVPEEDLTNALEYITLCMSTTPEWAAGLPIACEAKQGTSYGNCK